MTSEAGFFLYTLTVAIVCVSVYLCFRGIAWVIRNGWRSMLGLVAVRAEGVVEWQDCDVKDGPEWDVHVDTALDILLTHEATPDIDQFGEPERWEALEEEFADLDPLAAELGERAS